MSNVELVYSPSAKVYSFDINGFKADILWNDNDSGGFFKLACKFPDVKDRDRGHVRSYSVAKYETRKKAFEAAAQGARQLIAANVQTMAQAHGIVKPLRNIKPQQDASNGNTIEDLLSIIENQWDVIKEMHATQNAQSLKITTLENHVSMLLEERKVVKEETKQETKQEMKQEMKRNGEAHAIDGSFMFTGWEY